MDGEQADLVGKVIGGCRVDRLAGGGAMGAVYQGLHLGLQKPVAIKIMSARLAGDQQYVQRFLSEARLAAQIEHPNIVQVLNVGAVGPLHFIVMQYVEGESVAARMAREGPLPWKEAVRIAAGIARGLGAAHAKSIIHRDIKPANVLLTPQGEPKVADLGLAKAVSSDQDSQLTQVGETMGTPQYMPPEQAEDARSADARADIYSLGCTLYHMLVGTAPFAGPTAISVIHKHMSEPAPQASTQRPDIPRALSDLIAKMMAKKREERPQSMDEVVAALEQIGGPIRAAGAPAGQQKLWLALAGGLAAVVLLLLIVVATRPTPAQIAYDGAQAQWKKDPANYEAALADLAKVSAQFPGTKWARKAEEAAGLVKQARERAAAAAFEKARQAAEAAAETRDYAAALQAWDDFPAALKTGEYVEKVRAEWLRARLPVRVEGFMRAFQHVESLPAALQYMDPEDLNARGREFALLGLRLMRGGAGLVVELEGWELKKLDFSPDLSACNVTVVLKLQNKFNKQREAKDTPQAWMVHKDDWYLRGRPAGAKDNR